MVTAVCTHQRAECFGRHAFPFSDLNFETKVHNYLILDLKGSDNKKVAKNQTPPNPCPADRQNNIACKQLTLNYFLKWVLHFSNTGPKMASWLEVRLICKFLLIP